MRNIAEVSLSYLAALDRRVGVYAVKPVETRGKVMPTDPHHHEALQEERRRAKRRLSQQAMLSELRSGTERRQVAGEGDVPEHIDIEV